MRCTDLRYVYVKKAIQGTRERCEARDGDGGDCTVWVKYPYTIDLSPAIDVYDGPEHLDNSDNDRNYHRRKLFTKELVIPSC